MNPETQNNNLQNPIKESETENSTDSALNTLSSAIFYLAILFFIIGFNFSDRMAGNWYQQFIPNLNGRTLNDITFVDSLTGYAIAGPNPFDTNYVVKTTSGGNDWDIIYRIYKGLNRINFVDNNTGFICGGGANYLGKTINGGINWQQIITPNGLQLIDMHILNADTLWIMDEAIGSHIYLTTNSGVNWTLQYTNLSVLEKLYFYNYRIGFTCTSSKLYKTTDSGFNWNEIIGERGFRDIYFIDSLTGWKSNSDTSPSDTSVSKTSNGGLNWLRQHIPSGGDLSIFNSMRDLSKVSSDTILGTGGSIQVGFNDYRGIIYTTTNGGGNWLFQIPDTSFGIPGYQYIDFINIKTGWVYSTPTGIHTTNGGDTTLILPVKQINSEVPTKYELHQNYPNPFNPVTNLGFRIAGIGLVTLKIFDITGKETLILTNEELSAGEYKAEWNASGFSSGIYFYSLIVDGKLIDTKKMVLLK